MIVLVALVEIFVFFVSLHVEHHLKIKTAKIFWGTINRFNVTILHELYEYKIMGIVHTTIILFAPTQSPEYYFMHQISVK